MRRILTVALFVSALAAAETAPNTLSADEKKAGWQILFDGSTWNGWDVHRRPGTESVWVIENGWIRALPRAEAKGRTASDIPTTALFNDFELTFDWILPVRGNSGVKYRVQGYLRPKEGAPADTRKRKELAVSPEFTHASHTWPIDPIGFEYQLYDDPVVATHHEAGTGGLYEILAPTPFAAVDFSKPHTSKIVVRGAHVEHWLDGVKVVDADLTGPKVQSALRHNVQKAASITDADYSYDRKELAETLLHARMQPSPIILQYHNTDVRFRNLKIRQLSSNNTVLPK